MGGVSLTSRRALRLQLSVLLIYWARRLLLKWNVWGRIYRLVRMIWVLLIEDYHLGLKFPHPEHDGLALRQESESFYFSVATLVSVLTLGPLPFFSPGGGEATQIGTSVSLFFPSTPNNDRNLKIPNHQQLTNPASFPSLPGLELTFQFTLQAYRPPFIRCSNAAPDLRPGSSACQTIIDNMNADTAQTSFGAEGVEDVQQYLPMVLTECEFLVPPPFSLDRAWHRDATRLAHV